MKGIVAILRIEADFNEVLAPAVAVENPFYLAAKVALYLKHESADSTFFVARLVRKNLFGEGIHGGGG